MTDQQRIRHLEKRVGELVRDKQDLKEENEALREQVETKAEHCVACVQRHGCERRCDG